MLETINSVVARVGLQVEELKSHLKSRNLPTVGLKAELIKRLKESITGEVSSPTKGAGNISTRALAHAHTYCKC